MKLRDGKMIIFCKDSKQQKAALKTILGQKVTSQVMGEKKWMRGVITGIPTNVSIDTIKKSISPPLRCFKCQKYEHVATVCRGKQRCAKSGVDHEYGKCEEGVVYLTYTYTLCIVTK